MPGIDAAWIPVVLAVLSPFLLGIGWWFKTKREDRIALDTERKADKLSDLRKIEELQVKIFTMQQERIADEANKRREVDVSNKLLSEMAALLKTALAEKEGR